MRMNIYYGQVKMLRQCISIKLKVCGESTANPWLICGDFSDLPAIRRRFVYGKSAANLRQVEFG
jgi:hypothetical protein